MSDGMGREFTYPSSHATNRYFIPNWGNTLFLVTPLDCQRLVYEKKCGGSPSTNLHTHKAM